MRNLVKYVGIGLLVVGLAACDNSDTKTPLSINGHNGSFVHLITTDKANP